MKERRKKERKKEKNKQENKQKGKRNERRLILLSEKLLSSTWKRFFVILKRFKVKLSV